VLCRFHPRLCAAIQPFLPPLSVFVTALCVGSPLAINIKAVLSPFGLATVLLLFAFHTSSFVAGYHLTGIWFHKSADVKALQRTISFETGEYSFQLHEDVSYNLLLSYQYFFTGMQSSLLALALANKFFPDPLVGVPPAVSECELFLLLSHNLPNFDKRAAWCMLHVVPACAGSDHFGSCVRNLPDFNMEMNLSYADIQSHS
jgi:predicted Na+-dependent transporter